MEKAIARPPKDIEDGKEPKTRYNHLAKVEE
jgi:hypothetical protein